MQNTDITVSTHCITKRCLSAAAPLPAFRPALGFGFALIALLLLSSCTTANWYHSVKASGENECRKLPAQQYEECMRSYDQSYQEYRQQREEAIQK